MLDSLNASQSVEDVPLSRLENFLPTWSSHIDPTALLSALSSQIPIFEDLTPTGQMGLIGEPKGTVGGAPGHGSEMETAGPSRNAAGRGRRDSEVHRIVWWRPHGDTALAPGEYGAGAGTCQRGPDAANPLVPVLTCRSQEDHPESQG